MKRIFVVNWSILPLAMILPGPAAPESIPRDWAKLYVYKQENDHLNSLSGVPRIIFFGDSITKGWFLRSREFFSKGRVNRGIGGQTSSQLLLRFRQDVIDLHPEVVHIIAGTNDIAGNTGFMSQDYTQDNFRSMVELAHLHGIRVILGSIPPAESFPWRRSVVVGSRVTDLNRWLRCYASKAGATFADYWTVLNRAGWSLSDEGLTKDGVHPSRRGYELMQPLAEFAIRQALKGSADSRGASPKLGDCT